MKYEVVSDQPCLIDAVGEMKPGEPVTLDENQVMLFEAYHGHKIAESRFPKYVTITAVLDAEE